MDYNQAFQSLPRLNSNKLLEACYIKNTVKKLKQTESMFNLQNQAKGPSLTGAFQIKTTQKTSHSSAKSLITSLEFSIRNFGRQCDSGYSYQTEQHRKQKFGHQKFSLQKLEPLSTHQSLKQNTMILDQEHTSRQITLQITEINEDQDLVSVIKTQSQSNIEEILQKKVLKVVPKSNTQYHTISFMQYLWMLIKKRPSQLILQEKGGEQRIIARYFFSIIEFYNLVKLSQTKWLQEYLDNSVEIADQELDPDEEDIKVFKKYVKIQPNLPNDQFDEKLVCLPSNISILERFSRVVEINSYQFTLNLNPPYFEIYDVVEQRTQIKDVSPNNINKMIQNGFDVSFKLN